MKVPPPRTKTPSSPAAQQELDLLAALDGGPPPPRVDRIDPPPGPPAAATSPAVPPPAPPPAPTQSLSVGADGFAVSLPVLESDVRDDWLILTFPPGRSGFVADCGPSAKPLSISLTGPGGEVLAEGGYFPVSPFSLSSAGGLILERAAGPAEVAAAAVEAGWSPPPGLPD